jgi:Mg-chelatase subunit ChlD
MTAPITSFSLIVPNNAAKPVSKVILILSLSDGADANPVTFTITNPEGSVHAFPPLSAGDPGAAFNYPLPPAFTVPDRVTIVRPTGPAGDPRRKTCTITLSLNTNTNDPNDPLKDPCGSAMTTPTEQWQIAIAGAEFSGTCSTSWNRIPPCIGANNFVQILSNAPADVATVNGKANFQCSLNRPATDIVVVLDRSGSMFSNSQLTGVPSVTTRMDALHKAVKDFSQVWTSLIAPGDQIGVVTFDDQVETTLNGIDFGTLQPFSTQGPKVIANIDKLTARNMTSLGGGLKKGDSVLGAGSNRRVLLVMSDGQQNTSPMVGIDSGKVVTTGAGSGPLTNLIANPYPIYTVTIGPHASLGTTAAIMDNMAKATGGFYLNTEDNGNLLSPFFLELLSNFVRFNSWETARLIHAMVDFSTPYVVSTPLSTTTQKLAVHLSWPLGTAALRLRVEPPVVTSPPIVFETSGTDGSLLLNIDPAGLLDPVKDWIITVEETDDLEIGFKAASVFPSTGRVEFDLIVLVDDIALKSELLIEAEDYKTGDLIKLQVRLSTFSEPENLGNAGDQVMVQVVRPGQSVGDLLSDSVASAQPPQDNDTMTVAQAKLYNELQNNPNALQRNTNNPDLVTLTRTGPGIYTGVFEARLAGHYNFLFAVEGLSEGAGRFSRQELKTVYVREAPAATQTPVQTSVSSTSAGGFVTLSFTPRTLFGNRMGPGWGNYFWFTAPGLAPFKAHDNLDGSYTATAGFAGLFPPPLSLHFLDVLSIIDDSVTPDKLPVPLTPGNVFIPKVNPLPGGLSWQLLLLLVFLIGVAVGLIF